MDHNPSPRRLFERENPMDSAHESLQVQPQDGQDSETGTSGTETTIQSKPQVSTLATMGKKVLREAVTTGSLNDTFGSIVEVIGKAGSGLQQAEQLVNILNNVVEITKNNIEKQTQTALNNPAHDSKAIISSATLASLQLFWNLAKTPELQQLAAGVLSQILKPDVPSDTNESDDSSAVNAPDLPGNEISQS